MKFKDRNLRALAECLIGDNKAFLYRSSSRITEFFQDCGMEVVHDGSTRWAWTAMRLEELLNEPQPKAHALPERFVHVLRFLMLKEDAMDDEGMRTISWTALSFQPALLAVHFGTDGTQR